MRPVTKEELEAFAQMFAPFIALSYGPTIAIAARRFAGTELEPILNRELEGHLVTTEALADIETRLYDSEHGNDDSENGTTN